MLIGRIPNETGIVGAANTLSREILNHPVETDQVMQVGRATESVGFFKRPDLDRTNTAGSRA
jgi:hypothetical protein